ncbi:MAG: peptidoglycan-associated lipoprotein Pal [Gammaproteobacteria bacterium]|nr:peptidoglycan-associated lipoprotein Pal [Rhodocyclaceae bacterium]MBU3910680.1 peptidoglycan-associated lipoprotein Pal [Gammaproteobacteria bacterium]MBU3989922.1 peptidoglycan-associated lipoprotein Pal [Gammaproteobacteria bacterium]MBU4003389.1 peptidoglycan-associated lipoprotein Pal [Gammaproteobacteria bacterium]MBU4021860.1 peptidoglycan-associated lipoprotein Pal [Gammaproteobacteria bacterium]
MRKSLALSSSLLTLAALVTLAGCSSQPAAPEQAGAGVEDRTPGAISATAPVMSGQGDPYAIAALKDPKSPLFKRSVYFDYDSLVVKDEFKSLLDHHAKFLVRNDQMKMLIQGHADERGSREYNLALGQKRAEAVKKALMLLGAKEAQLESVSLGEEKPACMEQAESCWAQNRRGDMLYTGEF